MPKNEDGEFELVLGNKQLLSMFFVVVVLLGVFFVMGYVVGRNSAPLIGAEPAHKAEPKAVAETAPGQSPSPEAAPTPAPAQASPTPPAETAPPKPEPAPKREAKAAEKSEPAKDAANQAKPRPAPPSNQPAAGATFLQLSATDKTDADKMVDVLRKSGFQAVDAEVPEKPGVFRVLVGPIASGDLNKTKADLVSKGFPGNSAIKKTF